MATKNLIFFFIIFITLLRLIVINLFPLLGDEAYYWQWSRHLDFGYYEQGPVLAFIIFIFTLFNKINNEFTVRLGAVLLSTLTLIFCILIYKKIYPEDKEQKGMLFNLLLITSTLLYSAFAIMIMHDTVMIFFYTVFIYLILFIIENPKELKYWVLSGISYALAIMSKFTILIIYPAIFIYIVFNKNFKDYIKGFFVFTVVTLIVLSPLIFWNFTHSFANIKYLTIRSGIEKSLNLKFLLDYIAGQILILNPFIFFFFFVATFLKLKNNKYESFLAFLFLCPQILFLLLSFKSKIEANWPGFSYLPAFFLTTNYLLNLNNTFLKRYFYFAIITGFSFCFIAYSLLPFYSYTPFARASNALTKSFGYKNIAIKTNNIYNKLRKKDKLFISTRHYQIASLLAFYMPDKPKVYILINHESSKNYRFWDKYKNLLNYNCLFIYSEDWESFEMEKFFEKNIKKIDIINEGNKTLFVDYYIKYKGSL